MENSEMVVMYMRKEMKDREKHFIVEREGSSQTEIPLSLLFQYVRPSAVLNSFQGQG